MSIRSILPQVTRLATRSRVLTSSIRTITSNPLPNLQDPYPLPLSKPELATAPNPERLADDNEDWPIPAPLDRTGEDEKTLRARLVYQTRKRGTLETDLILSTFARDRLGSMGMEELLEFDKVGL
jgi:succinate dehydrogenase assembly factor 2